MNNSVFGTTMKIIRKHLNIELVTTKERRNFLISEPNYYKKFFRKQLTAKKLIKQQYS